MTLDLAYPGIVAECARAIESVLPDGRRAAVVPRKGCCDVSAYWKGWPCLLPQHGPGKKHTRPIVLEPWQERLVDRHPGGLLRGLVHSDGCRFVNTGTNWESPRYSFSNLSDDIRRIFLRGMRAPRPPADGVRLAQGRRRRARPLHRPQTVSPLLQEIVQTQEKRVVERRPPNRRLLRGAANGGTGAAPGPQGRIAAVVVA